MGKITVVFIVTLTILLINSVISYQNMSKLLENGQLVSHTQQVLTGLERLLLAVTDAETGERGYIITGNKSYLEPYTDTTELIHDELKYLRALTADNPSQQHKLATLDSSISNKLNELQQAINLRKEEGFEAARQVVLSGVGKKTMEEIRQTILEMKTEENALLERHIEEARASRHKTILSFLIVTGIALALLCFTYYLFKRDITARKRAEQEREQLLIQEQTARAEAEKANRLKDEFLAIVSHELRTPLNAIIGWSHMLGTDKLDEATMTCAIEAIARNAKSQAQLIEDILDVSRIITGKLRLHVQSVDLAAVINAAVDSLQLAANAKAIQLQVILDPSARQFSGDPMRLQQVVWNLLSNAIKFTSPGGCVTVRLARVNSYVQITVSDTGQGISRDFLPHVFDHFRQADSTTTRSHSGLGLGLAIVRHIVELHGGTIHAESPGEGQGAEFTVTLPLTGAHKQADVQTRDTGTLPLVDKKSPHLESLPALDDLRVLVVDDDPDTLQMLRAVLTEHRATVHTAASAAEALAVLQWYKPDVLVSDLAMPEEDGYSLIAKVRAMDTESGGGVPAVALTAYVRIEDRARALSTGFQMFVPKPIEPSELITVIANLAHQNQV